ncbi:UNVERIFIED_CONTAM: DMT family transporter, partial [Campylobacter jejuni]
PFWLFLGGVAGGTVVISQAVSVPVIGVTIFTTSITAGQLVGGLLVDATRVPPGGKKKITVQRVAGVLIVMAGVAASATGSASLGFAWWWPLFP